MADWSIADSEALYQIPKWGQGHFRVNDKGHLTLVPPGATEGFDLKVLIDDLRRRGIALPILLRFNDLIRVRIEALTRAFKKASEEYEFRGRYRGVYPIKVNQEAHLLDAIIRWSKPHHLGLEAGSKPELQVVLAMLEDPEALIICNGYKDREYIQMALLARKLGRNCIIVVEKADEIELIFDVARELHIQPAIGLRAKLSSRGSGRWQGSVGDRAKFGLTLREIAEVMDKMRLRGTLDSVQLLHFHIGSQVTDIRSHKAALKEATRLFTELHRLGAPMKYLDVGGGLGVDYDGSRTDFESSMNYDVHEYANAIVWAITHACEEAGIPHPDVITEAGRAMVAHHGALIFDVLGVSRSDEEQPPVAPGQEEEDLQELWEIYQGLAPSTLQEGYHDALDIKHDALTQFNLGLMSLERRAKVEHLFWAICHKIALLTKQLDYVPEELQPLQRELADTYYCNFSVFQSAPDSWAIGQLFPILPIHKLDRRPDRRATLADITCDSDGKVDRFIDRLDVKHTIEMHALNGEPYYVGMFLVGAYQEILGDLHNLFGDTNAVHVSVAEGGRGYKIDHVVEGDTVMEVLNYVSFERKRLLRNLRRAIEDALDRGNLTMEEGAMLIDTYVRGLDSYTYLGRTMNVEAKSQPQPTPVPTGERTGL